MCIRDRFGINSSLVLELPVMLAVMLILTVPALVKGKLNRGQGILLPVSYTHLDVYKRQILHRFRNMIEAEGLDELRNCILTSRGCYQWNPHLDCTVDVFRVGDLSEQARREEDPEKRAKLYEQIVDLYRGRLLPQSASEQWVEGVSVRLHGQYRTAMLSLLEPVSYTHLKATRIEVHVGGIIGHQGNDRDDLWALSKCVNYGTVYNSRSNNIGGIVSYWTDYGGTIEYSFNFGDLLTNMNDNWDSCGTMGGIAGYFDAPVKNTSANILHCQNHGSMKGTNNKSRCV